MSSFISFLSCFTTSRYVSCRCFTSSAGWLFRQKFWLELLKIVCNCFSAEISSEEPNKPDAEMMYDASGRRLLLLPPRKERRDRTVFGTPIHLVYYSACIACTCSDIVLILLALLAYFYPNPFRRSPLYKQIFQKLDRFTIQFWYNIALLVLALFFLLHIISLGFSLYSIQTRRPWVFIPQLVLCLFLVLLLLFLFAVCTTISVVSDDVMWFSSSLAFLFLLAYGIFLSLAVLSFQQLLYEYEDLQRMLASSKTVHFKEGSKRRK